jgi:hypothetical protein
MDLDRRSSKAMCHLPPESTRVLVLVCAEAHQTRTSGERARAACADSSCSRKTRAGSEELALGCHACMCTTESRIISACGEVTVQARTWN